MRRAINHNAVVVYCTVCRWKGERTDHSKHYRDFKIEDSLALRKKCNRCGNLVTSKESERGKNPIPVRVETVKQAVPKPTLADNIHAAFKDCNELRKENEKLLKLLTNLYCVCASDLPHCNKFSAYEEVKDYLGASR